MGWNCWVKEFQGQEAGTATAVDLPLLLFWKGAITLESVSSVFCFPSSSSSSSSSLNSRVVSSFREELKDMVDLFN